MTPCRAWILACAGLALAACRGPDTAGPVIWQQPNVDEARVLADERDCRRRAEAEVERAARRERIFADDGLGRPGSFDAMMTRYDAQRRTTDLIAECMKRRGYAPAPK